MKEYQFTWIASRTAKIILAASFGSLLFSCSHKEPEISKIKCIIEDCQEIPRISVHDDIRPKRWRIKSCDRTFVVGKAYNIGDSIEVQVVDYR